MKKTLRLIAMALMGGAMFTACGGDDGDDGDDGGGGGTDDNYPEVTIPTMPSGEVKAGFAGAIEITGSGFLEEDYIFIGYEKDGVMTYDRVSAEVLTLRPTRISFGVHIAASYVDKTIKVYLDRMGYDKMPITGNITFKMPEVSEGYIPDPAFRATLQSTHPEEGNPAFAALFNSYGLLDVAAAANVKECGAKAYGLNLYNCNALSLEGIELLSGVEGTVAAWGMPSIKVADFSKWMAKGIAIMMNGDANLEKFIGAPFAYRQDVYQCPKLTHVDLSLSKWCYNLQLWYDNSPTTWSYVTYLDIRRQRTGTLKEGDATKEYPSAVTDYSIFSADSWMKVADNAKVLVEYKFLTEKKSNFNEANPSCWGTIFNAWKRGAEIEVYASNDITKKLGTVPMFSAKPDALSLQGANNWTVEDK